MSKQSDSCTQKSTKLTIKHLGDIKPLTENQTKFFNAYDLGDYFIALHGVAGTGKSFCAIYKALQEVMTKGSGFNKLIVVRSAVQSRDIGHLPGNVDEKLDVYQQPYRQICHNLFNRKDAWDLLIEDNRVEFISTSFIRGLTYDHAVIVVDECQNMSFSEFNTIMTRIGYKSKILFCGDYRQTDLNKKQNDKTGIFDFMSIANTIEAFTKIEFGINDICRSSLVKDWIVACDNFINKNTDTPTITPKEEIFI